MINEDRVPRGAKFAPPSVGQDRIVELSSPALGRRPATTYDSTDVTLLDEFIAPLADHRLHVGYYTNSVAEAIVTRNDSWMR